jgi:endonuclease/exonuclease/phosphatase family metal-dependent hydrolase
MHNVAPSGAADAADTALCGAKFQPPSRLKIYTQNVYGLPLTNRERRFCELSDLIADLSPDVAFLQEVMFAGDEEYFHIDGYHSAFVPRGLLNCGGLLTLCRVPLAPVRFQPFAAQGTWHSRQLTDRLLKKGWLEASAPDWGITLINTHLVSTYRESQRFVDDPDQRKQLDQLLGSVSRMGPSILGGDFNFTDGTPFHRLAEQRVEDVAKGLHPWPIGCLQPKLDHIFVQRLGWHESRAARVVPGTLGGRRGERGLSDHAGVSVELDLAFHVDRLPASA